MIPTRTAGIRLKGTRKGLSVSLGEGEWQWLLQELDRRLGQAESFFRGSQMNLAIGKREVQQQELRDLVDMLEKHNVQLVSLRTGSDVSAETAHAMGVRIALPDSVIDQPGVRAPTEEISEGFLLRRTLRSGQLLQHPGHVVVVGDVNPGAEIIAGGDVVVWGRVRGMVHAGALGDNEAIICALELTPTQLRIGAHIAVSPAEDTRSGLQPEVAFVQDGRIVAEPWSGKQGTPA